MATLPAHRYYAQIDAATAALAAMAGESDQSLPIPTCPEWSMRQLITHVGRAHRWAAAIAGTRSAEFIEFRSVPDGRLPDDHAARGSWLSDGAARLVTILRDAGEDEVWVFGQMAPASFWARRMAHETMVHCADARLATGGAVRMPADLAADAIDEWLTVMSGPVYGRPDPRATALAPGATLHVHATDAEQGGDGEWLVRHLPDGVRVEAGGRPPGTPRDAGPGGRPPGTPRDADVALSGPAAEVLLVLLRRRLPTDPAVRVAGDRTVLDKWLSQTSF